MAMADELQKRILFTRAQGLTKTADLYQEAADRGAALKASEGLTTAEMIVEATKIVLLIKEADELFAQAALNRQAHL